MAEPNTRMSDEWAISVMDKNPCRKLESGNILTCPVRLSFPWLFKKQKAMEEGQTDKYACTLLFHYLADVSVLKDAANALAEEHMGKSKGGPAPHSPFKDQEEKAQFDGYVPGAIFLTASSERRAPVVDTKLVPIIDESKVYPGVWAIVTLRPFWFDKKNPQGKTVKRGIGFGLQSVMIVADDEQLGGSGSDPQKDFADVKGFADVSSSTEPAKYF